MTTLPPKGTPMRIRDSVGQTVLSRIAPALSLTASEMGTMAETGTFTYSA